MSRTTLRSTCIKYSISDLRSSYIPKLGPFRRACPKRNSGTICSKCTEDLLRRGNTAIFRWISIGIIFLGVLLTVFELISYSRERSAFPAGTVIGGVPVAGLDRQEAAERLIQVYSTPVEMHYGDAIIQIKPSVAGFKIDIESMLAAADQQRVSQPFWNAFWDYLWNQQPEPIDIPLRADTSDERLRTYLSGEVAPRYDREALASQPIPGSSSFQPEIGRASCRERV